MLLFPRALIDKLGGPSLDALERPVAGSPTTQLDERVVLEQRVHRIEEEGHVIKGQVARCLLADQEELFAHEIEVGHDDDVDSPLLLAGRVAGRGILVAGGRTVIRVVVLWSGHLRQPSAARGT